MGEREAEVISTIDIPSRDPKRVGKIDVLVSYRIGPFQSGLVTIPKEKFTDTTLEEAVKKDVEEKAKYVGKKIKV